MGELIKFKRPKGPSKVEHALTYAINAWSLSREHPQDEGMHWLRAQYSSGSLKEPVGKFGSLVSTGRRLSPSWLKNIIESSDVFYWVTGDSPAFASAQQLVTDYVAGRIARRPYPSEAKRVLQRLGKRIEVLSQQDPPPLPHRLVAQAALDTIRRTRLHPQPINLEIYRKTHFLGEETPPSPTHPRPRRNSRPRSTG